MTARLEPLPTLEMIGVGKAYQRGRNHVQALSDFSLRCFAGEIVGMLGPNGAGKTTAIKALTGLVTIDEGEIRSGAQPVRGKTYLRDVAVLLEGRGALQERLTTYENARYFCGLREARFDRAYFERLIMSLDISTPDVPIRLLSTGNKLKSALLLCLVHRPKIIILDEPTIGLDMMGVERLIGLLRHAAAEGSSIIVSSHSLDFIERVAARIVCVNRGKKVFDGVRDAFAQLDYAYCLALSGNLAELMPVRSVCCSQTRIETDDSNLRLFFDSHSDLCDFVASNLPLLYKADHLGIEPASLKDKYRAILQDGK